MPSVSRDSISVWFWAGFAIGCPQFFESSWLCGYLNYPDCAFQSIWHFIQVLGSKFNSSYLSLGREKDTVSVYLGFLKNQKHLPLPWAACWLRAEFGGLGLPSWVPLCHNWCRHQLLLQIWVRAGESWVPKLGGEAAETNLVPSAAIDISAPNSRTDVLLTDMWLENVQCRRLGFNLSPT